MRKIKLAEGSAEKIQALLKSKEDYKIASRLVSILPLLKEKVVGKLKNYCY